MTQFYYSFCMALLHSVWQAALLWILYRVANASFLKKTAPIVKRNFLFGLLATQFLLFFVSFNILFFKYSIAGVSSVAAYFSNLIPSGKVQQLTPAIFAIYIVFLVVKLYRGLYGWHQFKNQYKTGLRKPPVDLKLFTRLKASQFGIKKNVSLWVSENIKSPVTFGFFKPVILLPVALLANISTQQAETLILHELTHIRTHDYVLNWVLLSLESLFFFNPFITDICKQIRLEREKNCDLRVISFSYPPELYAETLLQAEKLKQLAPAFQLSAVSQKKQLLHRIQYFCSPKNLDRSPGFNLVAPIVGLLILMYFSVAVIFTERNKEGPVMFSSSMPFVPFEKFIVPDIETGKTIINAALNENKSTENTSATQACEQVVIKKTAVITKEEKVEKDPTPVMADNGYLTQKINLIPVAKMANDAGRQIIIQEECSGTAGTSVKVLNLSFEDGRWILKPEWVITAKEIYFDSLHIDKDSLHKKLNLKAYSSQQ